jgi:hypothetical protein
MFGMTVNNFAIYEIISMATVVKLYVSTTSAASAGNVHFPAVEIDV